MPEIDPRDVELWAAIEHDNPQQLRALLVSGVAPSYHRADGWTPLHHAVDCEADFSQQSDAPRDLRLVQPLVDAGADVHAVWVNDSGEHKTALDIAKDYGYEAAIEVLSRAAQ